MRPQAAHFRLVWDRGLQSVPTLDAPPETSAPALDSSSASCLWVGGFLADRPALLRQVELPETACDARLLEALYRRRGDRLPHHLCGSSAFVLWDGARRRLLLACDRLGLCGLYLRSGGQRLEVSDRIDLLLDQPPRAEQLNEVSVTAHLQGGSPFPGSTFHRHIQALKAGTVTVVAPDSLQVVPYWAPRLPNSLKLGSDAEYAEVLRGLLTETTAGYVSEARAGIAISGGLDSTSAAAALRKASPSTRLAAFSCVSPEAPAADESALSRAVCDWLDLPLTEVSSSRCFPMRDGIAVGLDSPYRFYYSEIWDALFEEARRAGLSVMLSGGGGDHLFGGGVSSIPDLLMTGRWGKAAGSLAAQMRRSRLSFSQALRRAVLGPIFRAYFPWWRRRSFSPRPWLTPRCRRIWRETMLKPERPRLDLPGRIYRLRLLDVPRISQVCGSLNRQGFAHGIELRHPLLDHRLVEFALSLPSHQTFRNGVDKFVLRRAMAGFLPEKVLERRNKTAPGAILHRSVSQKRRDYVGSLTREMRAAELGFVEEAPLRQAIQDYAAGKHREAAFWEALTLEAWLRRWF